MLLTGYQKPTLSLIVSIGFLLLNAEHHSSNSSLGEVLEFKALIGSEIRLPCNTTLLTPNDAISLIFWYKGEITGAPIYSVDSRHSNNIDEAKHFATNSLKERIFFNISVQHTSYLTISDLREEDNGEYRCRVDFRWARTINTVIRLRVIVPPREILIKDDKGYTITDVAGPYNENATLNLTCIAIGGDPSPTVHWLNGQDMVDDTYSSSVNKDELISINEIRLLKLSRKDLNKVLTCHVTNDELSKPLIRSVTLNMNLSPLTVKIISIQRPLSEGKTVSIVCQSEGSRPPAQITWLINDKPLSQSIETLLNGNNVTKSELSFLPSRKDNGAYLICKAENLRLANDGLLFDRWHLNIYYKPEVSLVVQSKLEAGSIREGGELILECKIDSNPIIIDVGWMFNDKPLETDSRRGIIIQNTTFVIKVAQRHFSGNYSCFAENIEGKSISEPLEVFVSYVPSCGNTSQMVFGAEIGKTTKINCNLDAYPDNIDFLWKLNGTELDDEEFHYSNERLTSVLHFKPSSSSDYGSIECLGKNFVGTQEKPCIFTIIPAGPPNSVRDCSVTNQTWNSIFLRCLPGFDGGLPQTFHFRVYDAKREKLLFNVTRHDTPHFSVSGLTSGASYILEIHSENGRGSSNYVILTAQTVGMLRRSSEHITSITFDPFLAIVIGLSSTFVLVSIIIVLILNIRSRDERNSSNKHRKSAHKCSKKEKLHESRDPDVVPSRIATLGEDRQYNVRSKSASRHKRSLMDAYTVAVSHVPKASPNSSLCDMRLKLCLSQEDGLDYDLIERENRLGIIDSRSSQKLHEHFAHTSSCSTSLDNTSQSLRQSSYGTIPRLQGTGDGKREPIFFSTPV